MYLQMLLREYFTLIWKATSKNLSNRILTRFFVCTAIINEKLVKQQKFQPKADSIVVHNHTPRGKDDGNANTVIRQLL